MTKNYFDDETGGFDFDVDTAIDSVAVPTTTNRSSTMTHLFASMYGAPPSTTDTDVSSTLDMAVRAKIDEFVAEERLFSAYDVTKALRNDGIRRVKHDDVRLCVRQYHYVWTNNYTRTLYTTKSGPTWVYYPPWKSVVTDYDPYDVKDLRTRSNNNDTHPVKNQPLATTGLQLPRLQHSADMSTDDDDEASASAAAATCIVKPDRSGRMGIPASVTRRLGLSAGDTAYLWVESGFIFVRAKPSAVNGKATTTLKLDHHGGLRIRRGILAKAGLATQQLCVHGPTYGVVHVAMVGRLTQE